MADNEDIADNGGHLCALFVQKAASVPK